MPANESLRAYLREREIHKNLVRGGQIPSVGDLIAGFPFAKESIDYDLDMWCREYLATAGDADSNDDTIVAVTNLRDHGLSKTWLELAYAAFKTLRHSMHPNRLLVYIACSDGKAEYRNILARKIRRNFFTSTFDESYYEYAVAQGLMLHPRDSMEKYCSAGIQDYEERHTETQQVSTAEAENKAASDELLELLTHISEDRAEVHKTDNPAPNTPLILPASVRQGLIVVPTLGAGATSIKREIKKEFEGIDGKILPLVQRGDLFARRCALVGRWPHAEAVIDTILGDLAASESIYFRPTILVGEPGSGKTSLAKAIAKEFCLPVTVFNMSGMSDASAMGTSAQWSTARPSVPLQLILNSGKANGAVIWDEVEKAGDSRHNGNALEALLPFLERSSAKSIRDLAIEVDVDLSMVSHFGTANSMEGIPDPLRDRMRILAMPDPAWEHIGVLSKQIILDIARDRNISSAWFQPLAEDELEIIRAVWNGGSLRRLRRAIEATLDNRDRFAGRA